MFAGHYSKLLASLLAATACCFFTAPESRAQQVVNGVQVFPPTSIFNTRIDNLPVDKNSSKYVKSLGSSVHFHPDWGTDPTYGIPYNVVTNSSNPLIDTPVIYYADESDLGPYPHVTTTNTQIEGYYWSDAQNSGDRHVLQVDITNGTLYEMWNTDFNGAQLTAGSGAIFSLNSNALRPDGFTSADAAGLPIFPLLVNYAEASGPNPIAHAFRFTAGHTSGSNGHIWPARHSTSANPAYPPFGQRFRLKKSFNISKFSSINKKILTAMKEYGIFYADGGSPWYVTGAPDPGWDDNDLDNLKSLTGSDFEAVDESSLMAGADTGAASATKPQLPPAPKPTPWPKVK